MHIPDFYEHYCPTKTIAGQRAISNLPFEMGRFGPKKAFVVMDSGVHESGFLRLVEQAFTDSDRTINAVLTDTLDRATLRIAKRMAGIYKQSGSECFIAIGGGPVMDAVKTAAILAATGAQELPAVIGPAVKLPKIFAVPVTYAFGFQVTNLAQVFDEEKKVSVFVKSEELIPLMAVLDPKATLKTTARNRAIFAMDALSRGIEAAILPECNPVITIYAKACIELVRKFLESVVDDRTRTKEADRAMANASLYAGIAFSHASAGIIAATAHALKSIAGIEPGLAGAILLPWGLDFYSKKSLPDILELSGVLAGTTRFLSEEKQLGVISDSIRTLHGLTGLPESLRAAGVIQGQLKKAGQEAANAGNPYYNKNLFTAQDALSLLEKAY